MTTPTTINVPVTPQQQMALAWRGFPLPEVTRKSPHEYLAFTIREDGQWVEALGRDPFVAVQSLVREVSRP